MKELLCCLTFVIHYTQASIDDTVTLSAYFYARNTCKAPSINETISTLQDSHAILQRDFAANDEDLKQSIFEFEAIVENIVMQYEKYPLPRQEMISIATALIDFSETMMDVINYLTCDTGSCYTSAESSKKINITEEHILHFLTVIVDNAASNITINAVEIESNSIVAMAVRSNRDRMDEIVTSYSSVLDIPKVGTNFSSMGDDELTMYVLSYSDNKYDYIDNKQVINTGTSRTLIRDQRGYYLDLYGPKDTIIMKVSANAAMNDPKFWYNVTSGSLLKFTVNVPFYNNMDGVLVNVVIKTIKRCVMIAQPYANWTTDPLTSVIELEVEGGYNMSVTKAPQNVKIVYSSQTLSFTFVPPDDDSEMIPLDMNFDCSQCLNVPQIVMVIVQSRMHTDDDLDLIMSFIELFIKTFKTFNYALTIYDVSFRTVFDFANTYPYNIPGLRSILNSTQLMTNGLNDAQVHDALIEVAGFFDHHADPSKEKIAVVMTDAQVKDIDGLISVGKEYLTTRAIRTLAIGFGDYVAENVSEIADYRTDWNTLFIKRETDITDTDFMDSLKLLLDKFCYGDNTEMVYNKARYGRVSAFMLNVTTNTWQRSPNIKMKSINTKRVAFRANFLGTFGSNVFVIPPDTINFEEIFTDFASKLEETPYVLAVNVTFLVLLIIVAAILHYFDYRDRRQWEYLPLLDNPINGSYSYHISFHTGLWSASHLTSTPFISLKGWFSETLARAVKDGERKKNFSRWSLGNFILTCDKELGPLTEIKVWHDNEGSSTNWYLDRVLVYDVYNRHQYVFICNQWLSPERFDGQVQRHLLPIDGEFSDSGILFKNNTKIDLFDDYLWLSLVCRPSFSRFSRVQRLFCLAAMFFLSMLASAMWYRTAEGTQTYGIEVGGFKLNYKQVFVGFMTNIITLPPGLIVSWIFRNRKFKNSISETPVTRFIHDKASIPWWTIFIGYIIAILCIASGAAFTFFYSLEWGKETTLDWLTSLFVGLFGGVIFVEPVKVVLLSLLLSCVCKAYARRKLEVMAPVEIKRYDTDMTDEIDEYKNNCDDDKIPYDIPEQPPEQSTFAAQFYYRLRLDRKLMEMFRELTLLSLYISLVAIICAHNSIHASYLQNNALKRNLSPLYKLNSTTDIWDWLQGTFVDKVYPKLYYENTAILGDARENIYDNVSYRIGPARLRQVRAKGACSVPKVLRSVITVCPPAFSKDVEETQSYCRGWNSYDSICSNTAWAYKTGDQISARKYRGILNTYPSAGYVQNIDPNVREPRNNLYELRAYDWIDNKTRLVTVEFVVFNADSKLFSMFTTNFEYPKVGGIFTEINLNTVRLYPYIGTFDYFVLVIQIIFLLVTFYRMLLYFYTVWEKRGRCITDMAQWMRLVSLTTSLVAVISYIIRIDRTIYSIEQLFNNEDTFITLDTVNMADQIYKVAISVELFIAILNLLKPLSFNYYLFVMRTSLVVAAKDLLSFLAIVIILFIGFGTLCFIWVGPYSEAFKDLPSAILTLLRTFLAMVKFRDLFRMENLETSIIFSFFMFIMAIVIINFFISILNDAFTYVTHSERHSKEFKEFDEELNLHFWSKINGILSTFQTNEPPKADTYVEDTNGVICNAIRLDNQIFRIADTVLRAGQKEEIVPELFDIKETKDLLEFITDD